MYPEDPELLRIIMAGDREIITKYRDIQIIKISEYKDG